MEYRDAVEAAQTRWAEELASSIEAFDSAYQARLAKLKHGYRSRSRNLAIEALNQKKAQFDEKVESLNETFEESILASVTEYAEEDVEALDSEIARIFTEYEVTSLSSTKAIGEEAVALIDNYYEEFKAQLASCVGTIDEGIQAQRTNFE